jgi:ceramide glucosyltransferase
MEVFFVCTVVAIIGLVIYVFQVYAVSCQMVSSRQILQGRTSSSQHFCPPVSILKPLKGLDDNLFDNLASFCNLDYPQYEVIFALQDYNDPAYRVACMIKQKHPQCDISIIVQRCEIGLNPKVNNLVPAYRISKYPFFLISDSNVQVEKNYLKDIVSMMSEAKVGLVCNMIRGINGRSFGSILENLHMNSFVVGSVCMLSRFLNMPCVIGKSMLMRKSDFEEIGGFGAVKDVLAEDYLLGRLLYESGKKVEISNHLINNVNEFWSIKRFINRHTRWGKLRWKIGGFCYIFELLANPIFLSIVPLLGWEANRLTITCALLVSCFKIAPHYLQARMIGGSIKASHYLWVPLKDLLIGLIWFVPLFNRTVVWRGNKYIIGKESRLSPYSESRIQSIFTRFSNSIMNRLAYKDAV